MPNVESRVQCDQIGLFSKDLGKQFPYKSVLIFDDFWDYFKKTTLFYKLFFEVQNSLFWIVNPFIIF